MRQSTSVQMTLDLCRLDIKSRYVVITSNEAVDLLNWTEGYGSDLYSPNMKITYSSDKRV